MPTDPVLDPDQILRPPYIQRFTLDPLLKTIISVYLTRILGRRRTEIAAQLLLIMPLWGKMQIRGGGDILRTALAFRRTKHLDQRNNTCIRVSEPPLVCQ